jgi:RNA polymerase sigma-70 factor (ECF subfamily)
VYLTPAAAGAPPLALTESAAPAGLAALVHDARAGDAEAFEHLVLLTQRRVASVAYRMLGSREDAREATQEVYLRVFRFLRSFREGEDFHAWLYGLTMNVCRDLLRKRRATVDLPENDAALPHALVEAPCADGVAEARQRAALLARALSKLPERERRALVLRDLEGLAPEDVARALNARPGTVRSLICKARRRLHALLGETLGGRP